MLKFSSTAVTSFSITLYGHGCVSTLQVKCHQYWPSYGTTTYGNIQVTLKEVENLAEYSIRTFTISPVSEHGTLSLLATLYCVLVGVVG